MTWTTLHRGLVFDASHQPPERRITCFTSLCCLSSGTILCGFQNGPSKHAVTSTIRLARSDDLGQSWQPIPWDFPTSYEGIPGSLGCVELVEVAPDRLLLISTWFDRSDPARPLFDPVTQGILKSKQLRAFSSDGGVTWSDWREIGTGELTGCASTGPLLKWSDGTVAFPLESFKEFDDPRPGRHAAWLMTSRDGGETFANPLLVAQHPEHRVYYWDQRLVAEGEPGHFTALFWTHDLAAQRDLTVHLRRATARSDRIDGPPVRPTTIRGQIAAPARLPDDSLLAFVVNRNRPGTMSLWHSPDGGSNWPPENRLVLHTHDEQAAVTPSGETIEFKQYWEDMGKWSFGHPALRVLSDETFLLAWYAGTPHCMSIHTARVRMD
jgi:hypothetical protein